MWDNDLYLAMREGRVPLHVDVNPKGDQWEATYAGFGLTVSVTDDSQTWAQNEVIRQVFDKVRNNEFEVKVA